MMRKPIQLSISVGRVEPLTSEECNELAARFTESVDMIATQLRGGALSIPIGLVVGSNPKQEPACRVCGKAKSVLADEGITLAPFDPHTGIRTPFEASQPSNHIVYWDCGCLDRTLEKKAAADKAELDRRNPVAPPHLPAPAPVTQESLDALERKLRAEITKLEKANASTDKDS